MTADDHDEAVRLAAEAELLILEGRREAARQKLESAAEREQAAADAVPQDRPRTRGILRVSAVSLWQQAGQPRRAAMLAATYLREPLASDFARELDELRVACLHEDHAARGLPHAPAEIAERARERELALARGEIASGRITNLRAAAREEAPREARAAMSGAFERYHGLVDQLRQRRRTTEPDGSETEALAQLEELFGELTAEQQEEVNEEGWRSWPELYDARAQQWHVIVPPRSERTLCGIRLRREGEFKVCGPGVTLKLAPRCTRCEAGGDVPVP